jgi:hypothetical protein
VLEKPFPKTTRFGQSKKKNGIPAAEYLEQRNYDIPGIFNLIVLLKPDNLIAMSDDKKHALASASQNSLPSASGPISGNSLISSMKNTFEQAQTTGYSVEEQFKISTYLLFGFQIFLIILLASCGKPSYLSDGAVYYSFFTGTEIMMFIGFGYLMTFLKRYGMGSLGFTMVITVVGLQWGIWLEVSIFGCL